MLKPIPDVLDGVVVSPDVFDGHLGLQISFEVHIPPRDHRHAFLLFYLMRSVLFNTKYCVIVYNASLGTENTQRLCVCVLDGPRIYIICESKICPQPR